MFEYGWTKIKPKDDAREGQRQDTSSRKSSLQLFLKPYDTGIAARVNLAPVPFVSSPAQAPENACIMRMQFAPSVPRKGWESTNQMVRGTSEFRVLTCTTIAPVLV